MKINLVKFQEGDIKDTLASIKETQKYLNYKPKTKLIDGIESFIRWYRSYKKYEKNFILFINCIFIFNFFK
jgi:UDP-glucuronate 4-epimerase